MKKYSLLFLSILMMIVTSCTRTISKELPAPFKVIPQPREVEIISGKGLKFGELSGLELIGIEKNQASGELLSQLSENYSIDDVRLILILDSTLTGKYGSEGYTLNISNEKVEIRSAGTAGVFYGCQTLEQLLEDARDYDAIIPSCIITDYPAMEYRAVHIDVKHHLDHMDYYYKSIDRLAKYKINAVIFEVEDKLAYVRQPLVGSPQAISIEDMAALTRYAAERHIEISPLVQGLGHATFILKHPEYKYLREIPDKRWVSCSVESGTYELYQDLFLDAFEATPGSRYIHIGGDEIGDIGLCDRCKAMGEEIGELGLYLHWLNTICDMANASGRIPIFWDDMPLKMAGVYESTHNITYGLENTEKAWKIGKPKLDSLIEKFPKNCVYMRWNYELGTLPGNSKALDWYKENKLSTMVSTAAQTNTMLFPKDERSGALSDGGLSAIRSFLGLAVEKKIEGMFCTAWDDKSPHFETYWRGLIASAEYSWSPDMRSLENYDEAYLQREYGLSYKEYYTFYNKLTEARSLWVKAFYKAGGRTSNENSLFVLPGLAHWVPEAGKKKQAAKTDFTDLMIDLPGKNEPGKWTETYTTRLIEAQSVINNYDTTSNLINEFERTSLRNKYHWEVFRSLNNLQITAPKLLLALKECDSADTVTRQNGYVKVKNELIEFNKAWKNLEDVYAETRYIKYPDNYIPDRYFHTASQREDLSWMIQTEELFHKMINDWISEMDQEGSVLE